MQITLATKLWKHIHTIFKRILRNWKIGQLKMFLLVFPSLFMFWPGWFYHKWQVNISYIYTHYNLCLQTINILTVISTLWIIEWIEYHIMSNELIQSRVWYVKTKDRRGYCSASTFVHLPSYILNEERQLPSTVPLCRCYYFSNQGFCCYHVWFALILVVCRPNLKRAFVVPRKLIFDKQLMDSIKSKRIVWLSNMGIVGSLV